MREKADIRLSDGAAVEHAVESFDDSVTAFLNFLALPTEDVLISCDERRRVINNLPDVINQLKAGTRSKAHYISKFAVACSAGLFDAALNFLWNETIARLRDRVASFDIDYFLDNAVSDPKRRGSIKVADDLPKLDDWELIRGCLSTGLISEVGYKHLDYIRDIRNYASAAHPNQNELTGLQVATFLETCIREVLSKEPEGPILTLQSLLSNIRTHTFSADDVAPIISSLDAVPKQLIDSLLRSMFGLACDQSVAADVRNNITLLSPNVWRLATEDAKDSIGLQYAKYEINGDLHRKAAARSFLDNVKGLSYLPEGALAVLFDNALEALNAAHSAWQNFYNEPAPAAMLANLVPPTGEIPASARAKYVKILAMCRLGNRYGVSLAAVQTYDDLFLRFRDSEAKTLLRHLIEDIEVRALLDYDSARQQLRTLATKLATTVRSSALKAIFQHLAKPETRLQALAKDEKFLGAYRAL